MFEKMFFALVMLIGLTNTSALCMAWDYTIDASNLTHMAAGSKIAPDSKITIPAGGKIVLLDKNNRQIVCMGKYQGPVANCPPPQSCPFWKRMLGLCAGKNGLACVGGGTRGPDCHATNKAGGVRSISK